MRRLGLLAVGLCVGLGWSSGASSNLIVNGDFEGNNAPWTFAGGGRFVFGPTDAGYGHGNTGHYAALESTPGTVTVAQALINELIIGGTYSLSWDVNLRDFAGHTDPTSDDTFRVYLDSLANPALFLGGSAAQYDGVYLHQTVNFIASATSQSVIFAGQFGQDVSYNLDNVQLELIPEPSTALLLGLGLVGMAARRRA